MITGRSGGARLARAGAGITAVALLAACTAGQGTAPGTASAPTAGARPQPSPEELGPPGATPRPGEVGRIPSSGSLPPVISSIPTRRKVVFLTIDDGWEQDPGFVRQVRDQRIPITAFVMRDAVEAIGAPDPAGGQGRFVGRGKWGYVRLLRDAGVPIENHTLTHPNLRTLGYDAQKAELCGSSRLIGKEVGVRPTLFRPPFGTYNTDTQRAAKACGLQALLLWTATVQPGGKIAYQVPDKRLRPGDILLLHFRPNLARDFRILVSKIKRRGFELGNLDAYLKAALRRAK
ncbi:polysaccharide deacetylase family protein [Nonomuraea africana]|uniref:Peptidoglycan/xylan/chitin deacetylase (PgdA/CDA1 family) n=1 Tax=Nonomuraea africana TaxID=46171 RepID=A0ABR9K9L5_9ACTN|nr:polysaccharide deacetylase family protein [Nonomuraea africana]MBE1558433.1 peptidoglycan/xylan/chitin deacetylase (PgdA/CDA1 family) [Nonomuraea africana]